LKNIWKILFHAPGLNSIY